MPKAIHEPTPCRRGVLRGAAALLAGTALPIAAAAAAVPAGAVAGGAAAPDQDAQLIAACERYQRAEAEKRRRIYAGEDENEDPAFEAFDATEYMPAVEAVCALPASTLAGFRAKATAVHTFYAPEPPDADSIMSVALWGLICDLATQAAPAKMIMGYDSDERLIADCKALEDVRGRLNMAYTRSSSGAGAEIDALDGELGVVWRRLIDTPARMPEGKRAKARAALVQAERNLDGTISTSGWSEDLALSALADIAGVDVNDPLVPGCWERA